MKRFSMILSEGDRERYDSALSDFMCWIDGFKAGGGTYSPGSEYVLRDLNAAIKRAYQTTSAEEA